MDDRKDIDAARPASPPQVRPVTPPAGWQRVGRFLGPALALALIALAVVVLRQITREITLADIRSAVAAVPRPQIALSVVFAALAMFTMGAYDVLSCRIAGLKSVSSGIAGLAGFCGYALANALGFHVLLGGAVRYRLYAAQGLTAEQIAQILAISLATIWLALAALMAVVFVADPLAVPLFGHAPLTTQAAGLVLGVAIIGLVVYLWPGRSGVRLFGWRFPVPNGPGALTQIAVGLADFALATAALWVVVPPDLRPDFLPFVLIFVTSFLAGSVSHSPGGLGVFEAGILLGLGAANRPDAIAALLVFRLTYYILPFLVAILVLGLMETTRGLKSWAPVLRPVLVTLGFGMIGALVFWLADMAG